MVRSVHPTMRDVAEAAGVSVATVSRVLSRRPGVNPRSEQAVLEAAERLGYRANTVARSLRTRSTATVGMVVPRISNPYFPRLVEAVERELSSSGLELLLCDSRNDPDVESSRVEALLDRRVDGLLFIGCDGDRSRETLLRAQTRTAVVQMDRFVTDAAADFVGTDNELGIRLVLEHLRSTGRSSFGFVSSATVESTALLRLRCYDEVLRPEDPASADRVHLGDYSVEWGREAAARLLDDGPLPDAIVCGADVIALGVNAYLAEHHVRVPGDVAVTGFDDISFASVSTPALTTLRQPADVIGAEAVRLLRRRIEDRGSETTTVLQPPTLIVRGSTATPRP
jgi:LacI family transcriptional regulator